MSTPFSFIDNGQEPESTVDTSAQLVPTVSGPQKASDLLTPGDRVKLDLINKKFERLRKMSVGVAEGILTGLFVVGEPGLGKTYTVDEVIDQYRSKRTVTEVKGHITPLDLYNKLGSNPSGLFKFDDCDDVFGNHSCLNILKAVMDTNPHRVVSWASTTTKAVSPTFEFFGHVIVVTNTDLRRSVHHKAITDRIHTLYVSMSPELRVLRIMDIADKMTGVDPKICVSVAQFLKRYSNQLGDRISVRSFRKCMELVRVDPVNWQDLALYTALEVEEKD